MTELERKSWVIGKHRDESRQPLQIQVKVRLELEEDRSQLLTESAGRLDDHVDWFLLDGEAFDVADVAAALDGEEKPGGGLFSPCVEPLRRGLPVEGVVQFNRVEMSRG